LTMYRFHIYPRFLGLEEFKPLFSPILSLADGKLARIRIHFSVSGPFNLGYADTPWIRIRAVSVSDTYPTRDTRVPWRIRVSEELEAM